MHKSLASKHSSLEGVCTCRKQRLFYWLGLDRFGFSYRTLQSQCLGRLVFVLDVFALHFKLVGFCEEFINYLIQFFQWNLSPLPGVAVVSKVLPCDFLWPLFKARIIVVVSDKWNFTNNGLVFLQSAHYNFQLVLGNSLFIFVILSVKRLNLIFLPLDECSF